MYNAKSLQMNRIYLIVLFPFFGLIVDLDCATSFSYSSSKSKLSDEYSLALSMENGDEDNYEFELYELTTGEIVEKRKMRFAPGIQKEVFRGVKPSTYVVYFSSSRCNQRRSISGKGIILQ